jgi:serine phosphatase RsbU (regulator of sigma subunit)
MDLLKSYTSSLSPSGQTVNAVCAYIDWKMQKNSSDFIPSTDDAVDLNTYLLYLKTNGADQAALNEHISALKDFYQWLQAEKFIAHSPFDDDNFDQAIFLEGGIIPREQTLASDPNQREQERLIALSQIAEALNKSVDIQEALDNSLRTLLSVMNLQTGWVSMLAESHLRISPVIDVPSHGFVLAAAHNLPPGLEAQERRFLCQPPACRCQKMLTSGGLTQAVNVVECTRLEESWHVVGDNQDLRFHASVPLISQGQPVGLINVASKEWQFLTEADLHFLSAVSAQLVVALERASFFEAAELRRIRLEEELQVARQVQAGLLPGKMPDIPGLDLACAWHPAREVSGDFYDVFPLDEDRWGIVIGDVVDKGTAAALYMAMVHSLILSGALRHRNPASVLLEVNQTIFKQSLSSMFVTVFLAVLDLKEHSLVFASAGHDSPILRRANGELVELTRTGAAMGMMNGLQWEQVKISLREGDALVLYTDGVTEARNPSNEFYELDRLMAAIAAAPKNAGELLVQVEADLNAFVDGVRADDDITFLVLTRD